VKSYYKYLLATFLCALLPSTVFAETLPKKPLLCALQKVNECGLGYECVEVTPESVGLPSFVTIDFKDKLISSVGTDPVISSPIERIEKLNDKLILQGGDGTGDNPHGGIGWTLLLSESDGRFSFSGNGDGFGTVVFGSCLESLPNF
jgi:hypothetical protein